MEPLKKKLRGEKLNLTRSKDAMADLVKTAVDSIEKVSRLESYLLEFKIRYLLDQTDVIIRGLKAAGEVINDMFSQFIANHISTKLEPQTLKDWENSVATCASYQKFEDLKKFLQARSFTVEERIDSKEIGEKTKSPVKKGFAATKPFHQCIACKENHLLIHCSVFNAKTPKQRLELVQKNRTCTNCFNQGHSSKSCYRKHCCKICSEKHNTLLHLPARDVTATKSDKAEPKPSVIPKSAESLSLNVNLAHKRVVESKIVLLSESSTNAVRQLLSSYNGI